MSRFPSMGTLFRTVGLVVTGALLVAGLTGCGCQEDSWTVCCECGAPCYAKCSPHPWAISLPGSPRPDECDGFALICASSNPPEFGGSSTTSLGPASSCEAGPQIWLADYASTFATAHRSEAPIDPLLVQLVSDMATVVRSSPGLRLRAFTVGAVWSPVVQQLDAAPRGAASITPRMVEVLTGFLEQIALAADPDLAGRIESLLGSPLLPQLSGRTLAGAVDLLQLVDHGQAKATAALRLSPRERGLVAGGETVVIPATARVRGAAGTDWRSDVMLVNVGTSPASLAIELLERGRANEEPIGVLAQLAAGESIFIDDILDNAFSIEGAAALRVTVGYGSVALTSRTYNLLAAGNGLGLPAGSTFGQFIPALTTDDAIPFGDSGHLAQLSHDPTLNTGSRSNLILVNGSDAPVEVDITLHDGDGSVLGDVSLTLRAWEYTQLDRIFEQVTQSVVDNGYLVVRPDTPGGRVYAMASVVDNLTGDPIAIPATLGSYQTDRGLIETVTLPAAAHVQGAAGTNWRTDMVLKDLSGQGSFVRIELLRRGQGNPSPDEQLVRVLPGQALRYDDVLTSLFSTDGAAALRVTALNSPLATSSRTYNLLEPGNPQGLPAGATFGQYLGPVGWSRRISFGDRAILPQLSHDPSLASGSRTNLVLVNNSTRDTDIEVELFRADGSSLGSFTTTLEIWEYLQIDRVFERVTDEVVDGGHAVVTTSSPAGGFHAQASVVDNLTGDPVTVDAIVMRKSETAGVVASANTFLATLGSEGFAIRPLFGLLASTPIDDLLDLSASSLDFISRTDDGLHIDFGGGQQMSGGATAMGEAEISYLDVTANGATLTGMVTALFPDFQIDGRAFAVDGISLDLDLRQVDGDHVAGTVEISSPLDGSGPAATGSLQFDSRICESFPVGGSITITIDGEPRTISFSDRCDGGYGVSFASASFYRYRMRVRDCDGNWQGGYEMLHLIEEDGELAADPTAPPGFGRADWLARGRVLFGAAELLFVRWEAGSHSGSRRIGWFRGLESSPGGGVIYYPGVYGYSIEDGGCRASYFHGRDEPGFEVAILEPCNDGPCVP